MEPIIFHRRPLTLLVLAAITIFLGYQASQLTLGTGFKKQLPLHHPYIKVLQKYKKQFGTGNFVLVSLTTNKKNIYNAPFLRSLKVATDSVFFMPGVDRTKVKSLWTPNVRYVKAVNGGFEGGNIIPSAFSYKPQEIADIHKHVLVSSVIGSLVSDDQKSALVQAVLVDTNPKTGKKLDYIATGHRLEKIRRKIQSPKEYDFVLKKDLPPFKAGDVVKRLYRDPGDWLHCLKTFSCLGSIQAKKVDEDGHAVYRDISRGDLHVVTKANPNYNANISVRIIGFPKVVSNVADFSLEVAGFFALTIVLVWILLTFYIGSPVVALYPLGTALVAVLWELGLLHVFHFQLDPFAILVPFLVLSIAVSHGIQITNYYLLEVAENDGDSYGGAVTSFRRLVIPGLTALLTNIIGFATILLIPIGIVQEMAINAIFGLCAAVITKKVLLPCILSYVKLKDPQRFANFQRRRDEQLAGVWAFMAKLTHKPVAIGVLIIAAVLLMGSIYQYQKLQVGVLHPGVPTLKASGQYNRDSRFIADNYSIGVNILQVFAKTHSSGCVDPSSMREIDRFAWYLNNTTGVVSTLSLPQADGIIWKKFNENNPRWEQVPSTRGALRVANRKFSTTSGLLNRDCSVMPVYVYTTDYRAKTINHAIHAINHYKKDMQPQDSPITFQLAGGNVGAEAATNQVIKSHELTVLFWLFVAIGIAVWLSFRGIAGVIAVLVPLMAVSIYTYAIMVFLGLGETVATLPVVAFAAGIGVDYGIYIYSVLEENVISKDMDIEPAYADALRQTGKAVIITAISLAVSVATWLMSGLQFQVNMGILLCIMYLANAVAALLMLPAFATFFLKRVKKTQSTSTGEGAA